MREYEPSQERAPRGYGEYLENDELNKGRESGAGGAGKHQLCSE